MIYRYNFSVMLPLVAGALSTQHLGHVSFTRIVLTLAGAFAAAFIVERLDAITNLYGGDHTHSAFSKEEIFS